MTANEKLMVEQLKKVNEEVEKNNMLTNKMVNIFINHLLSLKKGFHS